MMDRMTKDEHIALLKTAIVANLMARIEHDRRQRQEAERRGGPPKYKIWNAADLMAADPNRLDLDSIIKDPVRCALRKQLNALASGSTTCSAAPAPWRHRRRHRRRHIGRASPRRWCRPF